MNEEIFRKKSLDKLKSPESLDECIKVTNPGIWLILASTILLLAGVCVWGIFGHIDSIVPVTVHVENGTITGIVDPENMATIQTGMAVRFENREATVASVQKEDGGYVCTMSADDTVPDGFYEGNIVIQSFQPIFFILN